MCGVCGMVVGVVSRAADTFQGLFTTSSTAALSEGIPQLDKTFGRTGQTLMACTAAEGM